jgi:hypothetical protein
MKFTLTCNEQQPQRVEVHFSEELPVFPRRGRYSGPWAAGRAPLAGRHSDLASYAARLVRVNRGKFSVELLRPHATYLAFLEELVTIQGLDDTLDSSRYSLTILVGRCFDRQAVAQRVASCVCRHFYPRERAELDLQLSRHFSDDLGESESAALPDPSTWTGVDGGPNH